MKGKRILTGVKPTGMPHIGNYFGAMAPALELSRKASESLLFIADFHTLISVHKGADIKAMVMELAVSWLAAGLDPDETTIYKQSDVPEIMEIAWILNCFTPKGLMNRAHAYKAKVQLNESEGKKDLDTGVNMGLYSYPVLMAADILSFNADIVPVGPDQVQHIEITRDIAQKFNINYKCEAFKVPEFKVTTPVSVPGLDGRKMSKSYNNYIPLFGDSKKVRKKVMKITTDSTPPEAPKNPDESIIMDIFKIVASKSEVEDLKKSYESGISWGDAKQALFECLDKQFSEKNLKYNDLMCRPDDVNKILKQGAEKARSLAGPLLKELKSIVGVS